jgi:hypothetical protein
MLLPPPLPFQLPHRFPLPENLYQATKRHWRQPRLYVVHGYHRNSPFGSGQGGLDLSVLASSLPCIRSLPVAAARSVWKQDQRRGRPEQNRPARPRNGRRSPFALKSSFLQINQGTSPVLVLSRFRSSFALKSSFIKREVSASERLSLAYCSSPIRHSSGWSTPAPGRERGGGQMEGEEGSPGRGKGGSRRSTALPRRPAQVSATTCHWDVLSCAFPLTNLSPANLQLTDWFVWISGSAASGRRSRSTFAPRPRYTKSKFSLDQHALLITCIRTIRQMHGSQCWTANRKFLCYVVLCADT